MNLKYSNLMSGDRLWFINKGSRFVGIRLNFDRYSWSYFTYPNTGGLPQYLQNAYEAESRYDYYNIIKTIFEKRKIKE